MLLMTSAERVRKLLDRGVVIPAPEQVWLATDVAIESLMPGCVLHPGTRIEGRGTFLSPGSEIGTAGPATVRDCVLGHNAKLGSGLFEGTVLLDDASFGPCGHARAGTLFEEGASAAHAVGTKQTVLLAFATFGSNINCCDVLLSGGTGPQDHSEIGSGFIHLNYTPQGPTGDKATPSLFGDVPRGVWLRERRIFLGGVGGVVGPAQVGFGTVLAAGSVWRRDRGEGTLALAERLPEREVAFNPEQQSRPLQKLVANARYIGNLCALRAFYSEVRASLAAGDAVRTRVVHAAMALLADSVQERVKQLDRWVQGLATEGEAAAVRAAWPALRVELSSVEVAQAPAHLRAECEGQHGSVLAWLRVLPDTALAAGREWLAASVDARVEAAQRAG